MLHTANHWIQLWAGLSQFEYVTIIVYYVTASQWRIATSGLRPGLLYLRNHWTDSYKSAWHDWLRLDVVCHAHAKLVSVMYSVSQKIPPPYGLRFSDIFHKRLRILNQIFTRLLYVPIYARLQIFTARCTLVQSAVLRSHVVCLSVRLSVCL